MHIPYHSYIPISLIPMINQLQVLGSTLILTVPFIPSLPSQVQGLLGSGSGSASQGLREELASLVDAPLMRQMVARDALGGEDLKPILDRLMDVLALLLAPVRLEAFRRWRDTFTALAFPATSSITPTTATDTVTVPADNTPVSGCCSTTAVPKPLSSKRTLVALAPLLGPFCEFVALTVEEVGS